MNTKGGFRDLRTQVLHARPPDTTSGAEPSLNITRLQATCIDGDVELNSLVGLKFLKEIVVACQIFRVEGHDAIEESTKSIQRLEVRTQKFDGSELYKLDGLEGLSISNAFPHWVRTTRKWAQLKER